MRKLFISMLFIFLLTLKGCNDLSFIKTGYIIGNYTVYSKIAKESDCEVIRDVILYEDDQYEWFIVYHGCRDTGYYIKYNSNYKTIPDALNEDIITIDEIKESGIGTKRDKTTKIIYDENKEALKELYPNQTITTITTINEYNFYYVEETGICTMVVDFNYEGYPFGIHSGCYQDFRSLYLFPVKEGIIYDVESLINEKKITTKAFYELVYTPIYQNHSTYKGAYDSSNVVDITHLINQFDPNSIQYKDVVIIFKYQLNEQYFIILKGSEGQIYQVSVFQDIYYTTKIDYTKTYMIVKKDDYIIFE